MVSMSLISRSSKLAEAVAETVAEISPAIPVSYIGGTKDPALIVGKIKEVYSNDGVLVLTDDHDLLKAVAEAVELLNQSNILICPAPLAEGAAVAAEMLLGGADLRQTYYYATHALSSKLSSLDISIKPEGSGISKSSSDGRYASYRFQMMLPNGMHTSAASELINTISGYKSYVAIANLSQHKPPVNARSLNKIVLLNIQYGDEVELLVSGEEAIPTLEAAKILILNNFNKEIKLNQPETDFLKSTTLSVGLASGTLYHAESVIDVQPLCVLDPENEIQQFKEAIKRTKASLEQSKELLIEQGLHEEALIFDAHSMILEDSDLIDKVCKDIHNTRLNAAYSYQQRMLKLADEFRNINDIYMRERSTDIMDVARQVIAELTGAHELDISRAESVIIASHEVTPSMLSKCRPGQLKGIITHHGSVFSHVAILARALGVPAIAGYKLPKHAKTGHKVILDASIPEVVINPGPVAMQDFDSKYQQWKEQLEQNLIDGKEQAECKDGHIIPVYGNVGDIPSTEAVQKHGAEGIGKMRTEFLYLNRRNKHTEKEQVQILRDIFSMFADKPIYVRTLDIGGDKYIPWLPLKKENNPFMGVRGVRIYKKEKQLFLSHLKVILTAGAGCRIRIVIRMISTVQELISVKEMLETAHKALSDSGVEHLWPVEVGAMLETPSAALMANELAKHSNFFSVGTNDLCQYIMAAERGEPSTENLLNPLQPALLKAIQMIVDAAHDNALEVCVCGEMAGDPEYAKVLLGMGVDCISMNAAAIGAVKRAIRGSTIAEMQSIAEKAITATAPVTKKSLSKSLA